MKSAETDSGSVVLATKLDEMCSMEQGLMFSTDGCQRCWTGGKLTDPRFIINKQTKPRLYKKEEKRGGVSMGGWSCAYSWVVG